MVMRKVAFKIKREGRAKESFLSEQENRQTIPKRIKDDIYIANSTP